MTPSLKRLIVVALATILYVVESLSAEEAHPRELTASERELIELCNELQAAFDKFYARIEELKDESERQRLQTEHDPSADYVARFVEFESRHRGTHAGLMAARRLVLLGVGGGDPSNPREAGRRDALVALQSYFNAPELSEILRYLDGGNFEPATEPLLRKLMNSTDVPEVNRASGAYMFAMWALSARDARAFYERRLKELEAGDAPQDPKEKERLLASLSRTLPPPRIAALEKEAVMRLESLGALDEEIKQPGVVGVDHRWHIIDYSPEKTRSMPSIKQLAAGALFKERHLQPRRPAPDLALELVSGERWSLAEQRGRVMVIQFSFKGCGPCEAMYPDLKALREKHGERVSVLTIMADEKREDAMAGIESGKMTWDVHWEGPRGPIATLWSVTSFPTVYLIGPDGHMAARNLRGDRLKAKVAELVR